MASAFQAIVAAVAVAIALLVGGLVVSQVGTEVTGDAERSVSTAALLEAPGTETDLPGAEGTDETVVNSRGVAVNLTGAADSYVETTADIEYASDATFTLSLWARVDAPSAAATMTAVQASQRVGLTYNGSDDVWRVRYYDAATRTTYYATAPATQQPATWANLQIVRNDTHLAVYRNTTRTASINVSKSATGGEADSVSATAFDGRIDEVRTDDDALNATQRQRVYDTPVGPLRGSNRTLRLMFDQPGRDAQLVFFAPGRLAQSNVGFATGLPGETLEPSTVLTRGAGTADYRWTTDGPTIAPVDGGQLDGAPVAYVTYTRTGGAVGIMDGLAGAIQLAALVPILLAASAVVAVVMRFG